VGEFRASHDKLALKMKRECGWCSKVLEEGEPGAMVTTGMCESCAIDFLAQAGIDIRR